MTPKIGETVKTFSNGAATITAVDSNGLLQTETGLWWSFDGKVLQPVELTIEPQKPMGIADGLALFHPSGEVFEVRMLDVPKGRNGYKVTLSGYFDDPMKAEQAIRPYVGKVTIYHTLNPINPDLLARANNRLVERPKATTADHHVIRRAFLAVDADPFRPSGISATNEEVATAVALVDEVADYLAGWGWQPVIKAMSGNGGHLLYAICMPNDEAAAELIRQFLEVLAERFDTAQVKVDTTVFNASRIWKMYGTTACKGENMPSRPHRLAGITCYDPQATIITAEMVTAVIPARQEKTEPAFSQNGQGYTQSVIETALRRELLDFTAKKDREGRIIFKLSRCLTSDAHSDGAAITLESGGKVGYKCHHNSCQGKGWQHVKGVLGLGQGSGETIVAFSKNGSGVKTAVSGEIPPLPELAYIDPVLGADACQWLDECVTFLRRMSPRSYDGFCVAVALWLLSTIAARRVTMIWGMKQFFTNLYIVLCSITTLYAKSTVAQRGQEILNAAGLGYLLAPNEFTPQALINYMSGQLPANYGEMSSEAQERLRHRVAFAAQVGWFHEEFGSKIQAMMRDSGVMADFRGHLRVFDDNPPRYEYMAIKRQDVVERPYLAMLANMTPADIQPYAKPGAALWRDGFLARWAFVTPPLDEKPTNGRLPTHQVAIPATIIQPLQAWHERLGIPTVQIEERVNEKGEGTGKYNIYRDEPMPAVCRCGAGVNDAFYAYDAGLRQIAQAQAEMGQADLLGNYGRLPEKAIRIAMLLASLGNNGRIELCHWARAQTITEAWRADLHHLAHQMSVLLPSEDSKRQEQITRYLRKHGASTAADISRNIRSLSGLEVDTFAKQLAKVGVLQIVGQTQQDTNIYGLA